MKYIFTHIILITWLFSASYSYSQFSVVFEDKKPGSLTFEYASEPTNNHVFTNSMLEEISKSIPQKTEFTQFTFTYTLVLRITQNNSFNYTAGIELYDATCSGDIQYKGFPLSEVLLPAYCEFEAGVYKDNINAAYSFPKQKTLISNGYNRLASLSFVDSSGTTGYSVKTNMLSFVYNDSSEIKFFERLKLIDRYYLSTNSINTIYKSLRNIDAANTDMLLVYDILLSEAEKSAEELYLLDFPGKLHLVQYDPENFLDRFNLLSDTLILVRNEMNLKLKNLDKLYYDKGIKALNNKDMQSAMGQFKKSVLFNPMYAPSQLEIAKILFWRDSLTESAEILKLLLNKANPDPNTYQATILYTDSVYNKLTDQAYFLLNEERHTEAAFIFQYCLSFCDSAGSYQCRDKHIKGLAMAKFGIYQSFLKVAQKAIDNQKYDLAIIYIEEARKYQSENNSAIINDAEAIGKIEIIAHHYMVKGDTLFARKHLKKALDNYHQALSLCSAYHIEIPDKLERSISKAKNAYYSELIQKSRAKVAEGKDIEAEQILNEAIALASENQEIVSNQTVSDSIILMIRQLQYQKYLVEAASFSSQQLSDQAMDALLKAMQVENDFRLRPSLGRDTLVRIIVYPYLCKLLENATLFVSLNLTDTASIMVNRAAEFQKIFNIHHDSSCISLISVIQKQIHELNCNRINVQFDSIMLASNIFIAEKKYHRASACLSIAIAFSETYPLCSIDPITAIEYKRLYLTPASYQELIEKADIALAMSAYREYVNYYYQAGLFDQMTLKSFGLTHLPLTDIISTVNSPELVLAASEFYISKNMCDEALLCMHNLKRLGVSVDAATGIQQQLGVKIAIRDYESKNNIKSQILIKQYTAGDQWLKPFRLYYLKTRKSLK